MKHPKKTDAPPNPALLAFLALARQLADLAREAEAQGAGAGLAQGGSD